jgi:hypothetical protein
MYIVRKYAIVCMSHKTGRKVRFWPHVCQMDFASYIFIFFFLEEAAREQ